MLSGSWKVKIKSPGSDSSVSESMGDVLMGDGIEMEIPVIVF